MPRKVLLISTNRCANPDPVFPLGLSFINAALRRAGYITQWLDCLSSGPAELDQALASFQPDFVGLSLRNIDDVLIRKQETYYGDLATLSRTVREHSRARVLLGGSGFSLFPERLLELAEADFGICGEAEDSVVRLVAAADCPADLGTVPGLVYRDAGRVRINPPARGPLATLPEPPYRSAPLVEYYLRTSGMLNVQTQRGCACACCYCTYPVIEGPRQRRRTPEAIADEMAELQQLGAKYAFIVDSVFNSSAAHVGETCEAIAQRDLKLRWSCFLRPQGLTPDLVRLMVRAGLSHAEFGSDSFCDAVLSSYGKGLDFADIRQSSDLMREAGVDYCHFLICGGPGETRDTLEETFVNSRLLKGSVIMAVVGMRIYPGTRLFARAEREGRVNSETDLLTPCYYVADGLTTETVFERLTDFARQAPNWIVGDPSPAYARLVERLRQRGTVGPLWSYLSLIQRLWPQPAAA
jgi:radical SAM superfamily enzyme YgiQ (UPF0313 family)